MILSSENFEPRTSNFELRFCILYSVRMSLTPKILAVSLPSMP